MTPDEYNKKYNLSLTSVFDTSNLIIDLLNDFYKLTEDLECPEVEDFYKNISLFKIVFNQISKYSESKTIWITIWNKFYLKTLDYLYELFPEELEKVERKKAEKIREEARKKRKEYERQERQERKKAERERERERKRRERRENNERQRNQYSHRQYSYNYTSSHARSSTIGNSHYFSLLNLTVSASIDDIKRAYRKLSIIHHPDKGGSSEKFIEITEAKEKCLNYRKYN